MASRLALQSWLCGRGTPEGRAREGFVGLGPGRQASVSGANAKARRHMWWPVHLHGLSLHVHFPLVTQPLLQSHVQMPQLRSSPLWGVRSCVPLRVCVVAAAVTSGRSS